MAELFTSGTPCAYFADDVYKHNIRRARMQFVVTHPVPAAAEAPPRAPCPPPALQASVRDNAHKRRWSGASLSTRQSGVRLELVGI